MDGYAVRLADVATAGDTTPVTLHVSGDLAAGSAGEISVRPGFAVRIMTGAPTPPGAEAVVPVEWTDGGVTTVAIRRAPAPAQHIRRAGDDLQAGALVLPAGVHLNAPQIGLLAAAGRASVMCRPRPRVVVISTGDELVEVGDPLGPGQIPDSNSHALTAAAREAGALAFRVGGVRDDPQLLRETLDHLIRADAVITSGGVSVGAYDVVKEVLSEVGTSTFDKVAMQPGMPQGFGEIGPDQTPIFTLPGNPVSALVRSRSSSGRRCGGCSARNHCSGPPCARPSPPTCGHLRESARSSGSGSSGRRTAGSRRHLTAQGFHQLARDGACECPANRAGGDDPGRGGHGDDRGTAGSRHQ